MDPSPVLIIGLGNPGKQYYHTPHSLGFRAADALAEKFGFPAFKMREDMVMASEGTIGGKKVVLAKPQAFMNRSGVGVARIAKRYPLFKKRDYQNLWVINDDLDIPFGAIKIAKNRGAAGHKGVQSIIDQLKTRDFVRFRLGIQKPEVASGKITAEKFVLKKFSKKDESVANKAIEKTVDAIEKALKDGLEKAMTEFNR
jgi:PTH1 family peptidyl-tRNA hydrolase